MNSGKGDYPMDKLTFFLLFFFGPFAFLLLLWAAWFTTIVISDRRSKKMNEEFKKRLNLTPPGTLMNALHGNVHNDLTPPKRVPQSKMKKKECNRVKKITLSISDGLYRTLKNSMTLESDVDQLGGLVLRFKNLHIGNISASSDGHLEADAADRCFCEIISTCQVESSELEGILTEDSEKT